MAKDKGTTRWRVRVVPRDMRHGGGDLAGFLAGFMDMLRYDGCTVETWTHDNDALYVDLLYAAGTRPMLPRWASFSLFPTEVK